jgi:hypothetical protein
MTDSTISKLGFSKKGSSGKRRVLLDTNIWRYVIDNKMQGELIRIARNGRFNVQIAPAVLFETLRLKDQDLLADIVRLMANKCFKRLMPEAYSESIEILREVERARPNWLRSSPELEFFWRVEKYWTRKTGGFWVNCARSPNTEAHALVRNEGELVENVRKQSRHARKEMMDSDWGNNPLTDYSFCKLGSPLPGWRGDEIESWRAKTLTAITNALTHPGSPYRDWIVPFIEIDSGLLYSADWIEFWLYLVDKEALPRQWLRWGFSFAQRFRKVTAGTPGDEQLATYLVETDLLITADKALISILEECRTYAPCNLPEGVLVPAGYEGVSRLLNLLKT